MNALGKGIMISVEDIDAKDIASPKIGGMPSSGDGAESHKRKSSNVIRTVDDKDETIEIIPTLDDRNNEPENNNQKLLDSVLAKFSEVFLWNCIYLFVIVALCVLWSFPATVIPMTNQIEFPEYWWEWILNGTIFTLSLNMTTFAWVDISLVFNFKFSSVFRNFARIFVLDYITQSLVLTFCYLIWTIWLEYNHPIPMLGMIMFLVPHAVHFTSIWFNLPDELKKTKDDRKKVWAYILYRLWYVFYAQQQVAMNIVMEILPSNIQWIMAFIIPVVRESNLWLMINILERTANRKSNLPPLIQRLTPTICTSLTYAFWVAQVVSSAASTTTGYCLLAVDFIWNIYNTYKITKSYRKTTDFSDRNDRWLSIISQKKWLAMKEEALMLAGGEIIEFLVPIIYSITLLMALFGSNADKIGGIGFSEWQFSKLENLGGFLTDLGIMFAIDIAAWVTSATLLWKYSSINLLDESYKLVRLYWPLMSTAIGGAISLVRKNGL